MTLFMTLSSSPLGPWASAKTLDSTSRAEILQDPSNVIPTYTGAGALHLTSSPAFMPERMSSDVYVLQIECGRAASSFCASESIGWYCTEGCGLGWADHLRRGCASAFVRS
jgi:hypothetical protein